MKLVVVFAVIVVGLSPANASQDTFGRYHALVIGINAYTHLPKLETSVNDASAVHDVLRREYGYRSTLLLNPSRDQLVAAFDKLRAELDENDNLLIYYAGHGYLDRPTGEGFWLAVDAREDSQVEWLPVSSITRLLKATLAKHVLVVADSCYSGTLTRETPVVLKTGGDRAAELARLSRKRARKALTSGGLEPVFDGGGDGHSVFTRAFLNALRGKKEIMDGYQLYRQLRQDVVLNADQTPQYADIRRSGDEGGDFLFVPREAAAVVVQGNSEPAGSRPVAEVDKETLFWQSIRDSDDPEVFKAYLDQFPDGTFASLARIRLKALSKPATDKPRKAEPAAGRKAGTAAAVGTTVAGAKGASAADGAELAGCWRIYFSQSAVFVSIIGDGNGYRYEYIGPYEARGKGRIERDDKYPKKFVLRDGPGARFWRKPDRCTWKAGARIVSQGTIMEVDGGELVCEQGFKSGSRWVKCPNPPGTPGHKMCNGNPCAQQGLAVDENAQPMMIATSEDTIGLGRSWSVYGADGWVATWKRRGSSKVFDGLWSRAERRVSSIVEMTRESDRVVIQRTASSDGYNCRFEGQIQGNHVRGKGTCAKPGQSAPPFNFEATVYP